MKNLTFYCFLLVGLTHQVTAQITITNSVFPVVGNTFHYVFGNQPGAINEIFTPPGAGQQWTLSNLQPTQTWNQIMEDPASGSSQASFPGASILYNPLNSASEVYLQVTGTQVLDMGYFGLDELGLGLNLLFKKVPSLEESWAPVNFFDIHQSSSNVLTAFDAPIAPPFLLALVPSADSFRIRITYQRLGVVDAWGTMAIPGGTFDVLRKKQTEYVSKSMDVKVAPLGWIDISTIGGQQILPLGTDTMTTFHFLNNVSKEAIAICTLNTAQNMVTGVQYKSINNCPTITFTATPTNTCPGSNNGQIAVSGVTGGASPYTYSKDNGVTYQTGATFTGLAANTYQIVVKDNNNCTSTASSVVVGTNPTPSCSVTGPDFVCNNSPGNIYTAPAGMSAYNWSISGNGSIPGATNGQSVSVTSGNFLGNYTVVVTITDANGCTSTCSKVSDIFLLTPPADITVNPNPACFGATLNLSIAAAASSTVAWSGEGVTDADGAFTPDGFGGYYNQTTATPASPGSKVYSVSVTTDYGCQNTGSVNVTVNPAPATPSITGPASVCLGGSVTLDAGAGYNTYSWSDGGGGGQSATFNNITSPKTYMVTVTGANGCSNTDTHTVSVNNPPVCSITFTNPPPWGQDTACANSTGNVYSAPGGMSAYNWSISTGGTITSATNGSSVTVTAGNSGFYNLFVTITDANGCSSTCFDQTPIKPAPSCSLIGPSAVNCKSTGNVYSVNNGSFTISSYSWTVSGDATITSASNGSSVTVTAGTTNFTVNVTSTGFNACSSFCSQNVTVSACPIDFGGKIIFSNNNSLGVNNATVNLTGSATGSDLSDTNGDFFISTTLSSGSFNLTPTKTANKLNGVTAADVTAIQQHVTNITPITDLYKLVAADVNKTNTVNSIDASVINQALLGNPSALAQIKTSWRFVPTSHTMTNPPWGFPEKRTYTNINSSQSNQNFYGIKTADVATVFANPANFGAGQPLVLYGLNKELQAGENLVVALNTDQMDDLAAFQCAFRFDPEQLQFVEIQPLTGLPLTADNFGMYNIAEGEIRVVWAQATSMALAEAAPVFSIQFVALQSGAKLSEALQLDESQLPAVSYTAALAESKVQLTFSELTGTGDPAGAGGVQLLQNRPNPFNGQTSIGFVLPETCEAQLRVFDVSGRLLAERKGQYPAGRNEELLEVSSAAGILYYELTTPYGVVAKKMVAARN